MKILLIFDKEFNIDEKKLLNFLKQKSKYIEFYLYEEPIKLNERFIDESLDNIFEIVSDIEQYDNFFIFTNKPYQDNYFFHTYNNIVICSFSNWNDYTNLNKTNGVLYFIIDSLALSINPNDFRHEKITGCIYDFLWDKTGVDEGMRQARICSSCLKRLNGDLDKDDKQALILRDLQRLMNSLSNASKLDKDILEELHIKNINLEIKELNICNFRGIEKQTLELLPNINLFVGVNGSGKSTILDAIAISLSWLVAKIQKAGSNGRKIPDESIKNGTNYSSISLKVLEDNKIYEWKNIEFTVGYPSKQRSELLKVDELAYFYQEQYQEYNQLPMIAYYPINRIAKGIQENIRGMENISQLDVYDNALGSKANFQAFFEWFRLQDDIENEQSTSQTKWMREHRKWIVNRILKILKTLSREKKPVTFERYIMEKPIYLLRELIDLTSSLNLEYIDKKAMLKILDDSEYLLFQISKLSDFDNKTDSNQLPFHIIEKVTHLIYESKYQSPSQVNDSIVRFLWELFLFSILLSLWWLSDKGKELIENIFDELHPLRIKNRTRKVDDVIKTLTSYLQDILENDKKRLEQTVFNQGRELKFVIKTIEKFIPEYSNLRITRIPTPHMLVEKNGETIRLDQLSDGEKNMIAMIGDITRRLSMANPMMENPLMGDGIILIDEIDLHLHPSWQRLIVSKLTEVFPNCQFIITTHSPQILSHVRAEHIFLLQQEDGNMIITKPTESYGKSSDRQLEDILGVEARPIKVKEGLHKLFRTIQEGNLDDAKLQIAELGNLIEGSESELFKANALIKRKEILGK